MKKQLPHPFLLAPMAELTTPPLRRIITSFSREVIIFSEMLSAAALVRGGRFTESRLEGACSDTPFIYQVLGNDPEVMAEAAAFLSTRGCDGIDINMGCSAPDIRIRGWGSRLLQNYDLTREIIRHCRRTVPGLLSVKMRSGFSEHDPAMVIKFGKMMEEEGVDFITLHPRFAMLSFKRLADWRLVAQLQKELSIPVVGNGDITTPEAACAPLKEKMCSGVMIGREAVKSPWIFRLCNSLFYNRGEVLTVPLKDIFVGVLKDLERSLPPELHKSRGRRFSSYFTKNTVFGHALFSQIHGAETIPEMITFVEEYYARNPHEAQRTFSVKDGEVTML